MNQSIHYVILQDGRKDGLQKKNVKIAGKAVNVLDSIQFITGCIAAHPDYTYRNVYMLYYE